MLQALSSFLDVLSPLWCRSNDNLLVYTPSSYQHWLFLHCMRNRRMMASSGHTCASKKLKVNIYLRSDEAIPAC